MMDMFNLARRLPLCLPAAALAATAALALPVHGQPRDVTEADAEGSGAKVSAVSVEDVRNVSVQPQYYLGWPTVKRLNDGQLLLVYSGGRQDHLDPFGRIECMTSRDDGQTWTWPRVLYDSTIDERDAGILHTKAGTLLLPIYSSTVYELDLDNHDRRFKDMPRDKRNAMFARWQLAHDRTTEEQKVIERGAEEGRWMLRSTDGGLTWGERFPIPIYTLHEPIQADDGRILYAGSDRKKAGVWESTDEGRTWQLLAVLPTRAGEMDMAQAADGRLIIHVRGHIRDGKREKGTFQTQSLDGGKTWSDPTLVTPDGWPAHLLRLDDGSLITVYGYRSKPYGIRGKVRRDHGATWSDEFIIYQDGATWDLGYPSTVQFDDGSLLSVWYEVMPDSPLAVLRQARWRLP